MRLLGISDLHNNLACVRKLRAQELNEFDAVLVAGDIGGYRTQEIFDVLKTFNCPIIYIHGNWDDCIPAGKSFGDSCYSVDLNLTKVGSLWFGGFSFPSLNRPRPFFTESMTYSQYARCCTAILQELFTKSGVNPRKLVLLAHDRATRLATWCPELLLHVYGHIHTFDVSKRGNTTYVNISALDRVLAVRSSTIRSREILHVNAGNYVVIEVADDGDILVECRLLDRNYENWSVVRGGETFGGSLIPEDTVFGDNSRFPIARR